MQVRLIALVCASQALSQMSFYAALELELPCANAGADIKLCASMTASLRTSSFASPPHPVGLLCSDHYLERCGSPYLGAN